MNTSNFAKRQPSVAGIHKTTHPRTDNVRPYVYFPALLFNIKIPQKQSRNKADENIQLRIQDSNFGGYIFANS